MILACDTTISQFNHLTMPGAVAVVGCAIAIAYVVGKVFG